jgi:hypothetical protein
MRAGEKARQAEDEEIARLAIQKECDALIGDYQVGTRAVALRQTVDLRSAKVCVVESGQAVKITEVRTGDYLGKFRVHVVAAADDCLSRDRDYSVLPEGTRVSGWGNWCTGATTNMFIPRDLADAASGPMRHWLGKYAVELTRASGVLVRAGVAMDSKELCIIAAGEEVEVVAAEYDGDRLRLRIITEDVPTPANAPTYAISCSIFL